MKNAVSPVASDPAEQARTGQQIRKTIVLVAETRTGSNYLCELMHSTGKLGNPAEYFSPHVAFGEATTQSARCDVAQSRGTTPNGVAAVKVFAYHWKWLHKEIRFADAFPNRHWIWLRRRDFLAQAVSRAIALQTQAWRSDTISTSLPRYSSKDILRTLRYISNAEARWRMFFARNGLSPHMLWYEDLISAPEPAVMQIAAHAGVDIRPSDISTDVQVRMQRTTLNEEWKAKFVSEMGSIDHLDKLVAEKPYPRSLRNFRRLWAGKLRAPI